jgi:hypothetical protein
MSDEKLPEPENTNTGDTVGPASSVNNTLPRFSSTTGKLLKSSSVTISDTDDLSATSTTLSSLTASALAYVDDEKKIASITIGSGLDLTSGVLTATGGGGSAWTQAIDEPGTSLSNWTVIQGTWDIFSNSIRTVSGGGSVNFLRLTNPTMQSGFTYESDMLIASSGGYSGESHAGLTFFSSGVANEGGAFAGFKLNNLDSANGWVHGENTFTTAYDPLKLFPFTLDTYYNLRVSFISGAADVYINGVYQATFWANSNNTYKPLHIGLAVYNCTTQFKNIKTYALTLPV